MQAEYLSFIMTFIISSGIAALGILISFQVYQSQKDQNLLALFYHQVFLITFFFYGIWGNIAFHEIISGIEITQYLKAKLTLYIPFLGFPFLAVSWFMLLKFAYGSNGYRIGKLIVLFFFGLFTIAFIVIYFIINKGIIDSPSDPDLFSARIFAALNLIIHVFFVLPFYLGKKGIKLKSRLLKGDVLIYFAGVLIYSICISFFSIFGFISTCITIINVFVLCIFIPLRIRHLMPETLIDQQKINFDLGTFYSKYEISKREAEIIIQICKGRSNREIADNLFITIQTVKDHTHRIYYKTGVSSRLQLANLVRKKTGISEF